MTEREAEIRLLNDIAGVQNDAASEVTKMDYDRELNRSIEKTLGDLERAAQRAGTGGLWCFGCGASSVSLEKCGCDFGESFGCSGRLFCADCRAARRAVANHLRQLFAAKKVDRVSSVRLRLLRELRRAARGVEGEESDPANERFLSFWVSNCDEFGYSTEAFRAGVLRAFKRTKFLDFAGLARALRRQEDESLLRAVIRSGFYR